MTLMFKDGIGGCAGQSASPGFPSCSGCSSVSPTTLVLYLNDIGSEALLLTSTLLI